jgi:predicted nucleotidyltransferase component of viral defense system
MAEPVRLIRNAFELQDLVEGSGRDGSLIERDFALVTVAAGLVRVYGESLCFKGGFVLRHVYGHERFSKDLDATRINPPKHKLDAAEVRDAIRSASVKNLLTFNPAAPASDSGRSLDFDSIGYRGPLGENTIAFEVSYREDVILPPFIASIGEPYYKPFEIPVLHLDEIVAEKLRTLAQRSRPTDLSDLAMVIGRHEIDDRRVRQLAEKKFELVKDGNVIDRIIDRIHTMESDYDAAIAAVAPDAPSYAEAKKLVMSRLSSLLP